MMAQDQEKLQIRSSPSWALAWTSSKGDASSLRTLAIQNYHQGGVFPSELIAVPINPCGVRRDGAKHPCCRQLLETYSSINILHTYTSAVHPGRITPHLRFYLHEALPHKGNIHCLGSLQA